MSDFRKVASMAEIGDPGQVAVEVDSLEILLVCFGGKVYAIGNVCSHDEVWLDDGTLHEETYEIECPMHEGRFDLRTGAATHEPCEKPVPSYPVRLDGDDVFVDID